MVIVATSRHNEEIYGACEVSDGSALIYSTLSTSTANTFGKLASSLPQVAAYRLISLDSSSMNAPKDKWTQLVKLLNMFYAGSLTMDWDGEFVVFTACGEEDRRAGCELYTTTWDGSKWTDAKELPEPVNSNDWEGQPFLTPDGLTLMFITNRENKKTPKRAICISKRKTREQKFDSVGVVYVGDRITSAFLSPEKDSVYFIQDGTIKVLTTKQSRLNIADASIAPANEVIEFMTLGVYTGRVYFTLTERGYSAIGYR